MSRITRRETLGLLAGSAAALGAVGANKSGTSKSGTNKIVPFERGDVVAGCTLLDDTTDDHRGQGRLLHYDGDQIYIREGIIVVTRGAQIPAGFVL